MSSKSRTEDPLVSLVRELEAERTTAVGPGLWDRVEDRLPQASGAAVGQRPTGSPPKLRLVHSSVRRMRRLAAIAAVLLAVIGLTYFLAAREEARGTLVTEATLQRALDREALEGPLELDGQTRPLTRDLYHGVAVKQGNLGTDVLRACDPC